MLFPLGKSTEEKSYFFPLYTRHEGEEEHDVAFFPFFYGKTHGRSYGGVFPLYGTLYNRFRRDEIGFFLWPLYGYSKGDGASRTNVIWPLFSIYSGSQQGFKVGPLYGQRQWGNERKSMFVLWPFSYGTKKGSTPTDPRRGGGPYPSICRPRLPNLRSMRSFGLFSPIQGCTTEPR